MCTPSDGHLHLRQHRRAERHRYQPGGAGPARFDARQCLPRRAGGPDPAFKHADEHRRRAGGADGPDDRSDSLPGRPATRGRRADAVGTPPDAADHCLRGANPAARPLPGAGATEAFSAIKVMRVGGEPFTWADYTLLRGHVPATSRIIAAYSSTETVCSHWFVPPGAEPSGRLVPVGWVNPGVEFLLVDERGEPVPDGTAGVLMLRSRYLALGHWIGGQ